jgi:hypothetical protein
MTDYQVMSQAIEKVQIRNSSKITADDFGGVTT